MRLLITLLYVLGFALISAGIAIIILTYATKVLYTKVKSIKAGAGDPGLDLYRSAYVVWDETNQKLDSGGNLTDWLSNSSYADAIGGPQYKYTLKPRGGAMTVRTSNSGTKGVVPSESVQAINYDLINRTQAWTSFPTSNFTVIMVGSGPTTEIPANSVCDGMGFRYGSMAFGLSFNYNLYSTTPSNSVVLSGQGRASVQPIQAPTLFQTYATASNKTYSANTFGITYTTSTDKACKTYLNGNKITLNTAVTSASAVTPTDQLNSALVDAPNAFQVGSDEYSSTTSAYFAILVYNRVLNDAEIVTLNAYLKQKYFAPKMTYPTSVTLNQNEALSQPIANTSINGADTILSYSITPALPAGLVLSTASGTITGAATVSSAARDYTLTATNGILSNTCIINISVTGTTVDKEAVPVPNISIPETAFTFPLGGNVTTTTPVNTGGVVTSYIIDPANITQITGLVFDTSKGVLSGVPSHSTILNVSITAQNKSGQSVLMFTLVTGENIGYPNSTIQGIIGKTIPTMPIAISNGSGTIITFSSTGDLLGLTLDPITGSISGNPTLSGKSTVTIYAKTPDNVVFASTQLILDIQPTEEFKNKSTYLAVGGILAAVGAVSLGVAGYWTYSGTPAVQTQPPAVQTQVPAVQTQPPAVQTQVIQK